jgi:hypothetical protein
MIAGFLIRPPAANSSRAGRLASAKPSRITRVPNAVASINAR